MIKSLDDILKKAKEDGVLNERKKDSLAWFRQKVESLQRPVKPIDLMNDKTRMVERVELGKMYNFIYSPKTKDTLPYYDAFPLCIPYKPFPGGFYGLNLHYLYPRYRAQLLEKMRELETKDIKGELKFKFTYELLNSSAKYSMFKPCVKRYLYGHVKSKFIKIAESEWNVVVFLPTEMFLKEKKVNVWQDSKAKLGRKS